MMKILGMIISCVLSILSTASFAAYETRETTPSPAVKKSMTDYKLCALHDLATELNKKFSVVYIKDDLANYNYFLIRQAGAVNADAIRKKACEFIRENKCYVFWGNVANIATIAEKKAAWFPADTSPHYLISPIITCKDSNQEDKQQKETE